MNAARGQRALERLERIRSSLEAPRSIAHLSTLGSLLALALLLRIVGFQGYSDSDPRSYTVLADDLARGVLHLKEYGGPAVFPLRTGVFAPTALLIRLFGLSELSIAAYPFVVSVAGCVLAYALARAFWGPLAGLICIGLWAVLPIDVRMASVLLPDAIAAFWANVAIALLLLGSLKGRSHQIAYAVAAGLLFGVSWACKEAVVYLVPGVVFLIFALGRDTPIKTRLVTAAAVAAGGALILTVEMMVFRLATGDPFLRLHGTEKNYAQAAVWFFDPSSPYFGWESGGYAKVMIERLFIEGPRVLVMTRSLGCLSAFAILGLVWSALFSRQHKFALVGGWLLSLLFMFNFMTISFQAYRPLPLFDRYLYPTLLPASICFAGFLRALVSSPAEKTEHSVGHVRAFCSAVLLVGYCALCTRQLPKILGTRPEDVERTVAKRLGSSDVVYSDARTVTSLVFFRTGSLSQPSTTSVPFERLQADDIPVGAYVLIDKTMIDFLTRSYKYKPPAFVDAPPATWKKVWGQADAALFQVLSTE